MSELHRLCGGAGEKALLAAVLAVAVDDALGANGRRFVADGRAWFAGPSYRRHLELLGLQPDMLPVEIAEWTRWSAFALPGS